jgi:hypothetical protein
MQPLTILYTKLSALTRPGISWDLQCKFSIYLKKD